MRRTIKPGTRVRLTTRMMLVAAASTSIAIVVFLFFFGYFNTGIKQEAKAYGTETISTGSFIVNMGVTPQTFANGLKPYGMIYELTNTYNVPVKWIINPAKAKDGNDFWHNSVAYKGGAFVIPAEYITPTVISRINYWKSIGVQGTFSVSSMSLPVYMDITSFPLVMIDTLSLNDSIIAKYYTNAGIPSSAFSKGSPNQVNSCHDMWVNPHGDPAWSTHNYLYDFVTVQKSFIWMQCHAVSMMESCRNPVAPFTQLNYLTTNGLQCYQSGKCGAIAEVHTKNLPGSYAYYYPSDPVMQFLGGVTSVASGGSERWFIPTTTGGWRSTTRRLITTGTTTTPREGVLMVYGPAYGDTTNGWVMYMGGHDMNSGTTAEMVAAQRSYFNFLLIAGKNKAPQISSDVAGVINANATDTFSVSITGGSAPYNYTWTSSMGGTFSDPSGATTAYSAPHTIVPLQTNVTCVVTDACGRKTFFSQMITINASPLPISLIGFSAKPYQDNQVQLNWATGAEQDNHYFTLERSGDGQNFSFFKSVPSKGNSSSTQNYITVDEKPVANISWYRLSQTDHDGTRKNLQTVKVELRPVKQTAQFKSWPNPFREELTIEGDWENEEAVTIRLFSQTGKMITEQPYTPSGSWGSYTLKSLDHLSSGMYILSIDRGGKTIHSQKIFKQQ